MIHVTKEVLQTAYDLLRLTRPYRGWKLPPSSKVIFKVLKTDDRDGDFYRDKKKRPVIRVSQAKCHTLHAVVMTVGHEMCHLKDETKAFHGRRFKQLADSVCRWHHFDRGQF